MPITPPTPPTPPAPPKITLGDAARDAQANTTHTTGDAQAEQQARDSVAQGNGALSKTTHETPKDKSATERPNAAARTDAAKGDSVSTSASKVDHGTKVEGQTGADVANGLDMAQENAILKQQLGNTEQKPPQAPQSYTATSGLYWVGMIVLAVVLGLVFFRRFFQKKQVDPPAEESSLGERILAREQGGAGHNVDRAPQMGEHDDLLAAAERTRRARNTHGEILPEFTGLTAGEALARLTKEDAKASPTPPRKPAAEPPRPVHPHVTATEIPPLPPPAQKTPVKKQEKQDDAEEKPRFEVRV